MVIVADGTPTRRARLERVLTSDPGMGVMRHADAGYDEAIEAADERGVVIRAADGLAARGAARGTVRKFTKTDSATGREIAALPRGVGNKRATIAGARWSRAPADSKPRPTYTIGAGRFVTRCPSACCSFRQDADRNL